MRGRGGGGRPASHARAVLGSLEELPQSSAAIGEGFLDVTRHSEVVGNGSDLWVRQQGDILRREGERPSDEPRIAVPTEDEVAAEWLDFNTRSTLGTWLLGCGVLTIGPT